MKVDGLLLWNEELLHAPVDGSVTYPLGRGPARVAKGAVVAVVSGRAVTAPQAGYFIGGKDGRENKWRYSEIWMEEPKEFSEKITIKYMESGSMVKGGDLIGKVVVQPQELRFIGFVPKNGNIEEQMDRKKLKVRIDKYDTVSTALVRVSMNTDKDIKIYVTMPWFPHTLITSRNYTLLVDAGETKGVSIPYSALLKKNGKIGVLAVRGIRIVFTPVEGRKTVDGRFMVTKGLLAGDAVAEKAAEAREGRIQLW